jgi:hypothetical protein
MRYSPDRRPPPPLAGIRQYSPPRDGRRGPPRRAGRPRAPPGSRRSPSPPRPRHHPRRPDEDRSWDQDRWRFEGRMDRAPPLRYRGDFHNLTLTLTLVFFTDTKDGHKTLATKVYFKDTDRHSLLFNTSYQP